MTNCPTCNQEVQPYIPRDPESTCHFQNLDGSVHSCEWRSEQPCVQCGVFELEYGHDPDPYCPHCDAFFWGNEPYIGARAQAQRDLEFIEKVATYDYIYNSASETATLETWKQEKDIYKDSKRAKAAQILDLDYKKIKESAK